MRSSQPSLRRPFSQFGMQERMRWFWLGAYEVSAGKPPMFEHEAEDRDAVVHATDILIQEIKRLRERSAQRLLDASWPLRTRLGD